MRLTVALPQLRKVRTAREIRHRPILPLPLRLERKSAMRGLGIEPVPKSILEFWSTNITSPSLTIGKQTDARS